MELIVGKTYFIKRGGWECYCTFKESNDKGFVFDNSGIEITILKNQLKECVSE